MPDLAQPPVPPRGRRIMVIEDEEFVTRALARSLATEGHCVAVFRTTLSALRAIRKQPEGYELIVADTTLPRFSELEFTRELILSGITAPVVVLTGDEVLNDSELEEFNILRALGKPFDMTELCTILRQALVQVEKRHLRP